MKYTVGNRARGGAVDPGLQICSPTLFISIGRLLREWEEREILLREGPESASPDDESESGRIWKRGQLVISESNERVVRCEVERSSGREFRILCIVCEWHLERKMEEKNWV
ncbi:hypothetical protein COLO4_11273 [Corchorus olitorius]|uniref:Uncharacterized protein n=1 Tax=Corchorus olitorius TaxID=93759 RepID=A0A1R3K565_9ROSI|nr:hypothetical protein COLO4_11273 [Corchorus olitorius]